MVAGKRATRGSRRAPSPEGGSDDSDDDGEESEEECLREEQEAARAAAVAAADAAAKAAAKAAAAAAAVAAKHKDKKEQRKDEEEEDGADSDGDDSGADDLDFRLSEAGWPGASIVGAHKRDGATAIRVSWDDGEERWVDSAGCTTKTAHARGAGPVLRVQGEEQGVKKRNGAFFSFFKFLEVVRAAAREKRGRGKKLLCPGSRFPLFLTMQQNNRNERERAFSNSVALRRRWISCFFTGKNGEKKNGKITKKSQVAVVSRTLLPASSLARFPSSLFLPNQPPHPFLAPGIRTGCSAVPSLAAPSHVSTPHAFPVGRSFGDDAAAAAEGEALETDQKHFSASLHVARAIFTEEAPAP